MFKFTILCILFISAFSDCIDDHCSVENEQCSSQMAGCVFFLYRCYFDCGEPDKFTEQTHNCFVACGQKRGASPNYFSYINCAYTYCPGMDTEDKEQYLETKFSEIAQTRRN